MSNQTTKVTEQVKHVGVWILVGLLAVATLIAVFSLIYGSNNGGEFEGADGQAEGVITELEPDYEPWFEPIIGDLPGEVESGLFALQAALGAGVVGYAFGVLRTRSQQRAAIAGVTPAGVTPAGAAPTESAPTESARSESARSE